MPWKETPITSWDHFSALCSKILASQPLRDLFFRGQSDSVWSLEPNLVRLWDKGAPVSAHDALRIEGNMIQEFFFHVGKRLDSLCDTQDLPSVLALMQHYRAPTRLLDWTYSPYVAAYFAVED